MGNLLRRKWGVFLRVSGEYGNGKLLILLRVLGVVRFRVALSKNGLFWLVFGRKVRLKLPKKRKKSKAVSYLLGKLRVKKAEVEGRIGLRENAAATALLTGGVDAGLWAGSAALKVKKTKVELVPVYDENVLEGKIRLKIGF